MSDVKIPAVGESISEVQINSWKVSTGDFVEKDQIILAIDSDKASLEIAAEESGVITITAQAGDTVKIGVSVAKIDSTAARPAGKTAPTPIASVPTATTSAPTGTGTPTPIPTPTPTPTQVSSLKPVHDERFSPAAAKLAAEKGILPSQVTGSGRDGRVTKADVLDLPVTKATTGERETRQALSQLRKRVAARLVMAQQTAAILTTFNEIDMSSVMDLRNKFKEDFEKKYGVRLGFMGFFTKAVIEALKVYPVINSYIDGTDIVQRNYYDVSVAVQGQRGLVVPVIRNVDQLNVAGVEKAIKFYAEKARNNTLTVEEMTGGGFTISNGGVFGSLMSTPILNPPQSGILGLHKIQERPVVVNGQIVIRPMMYVALSYDHRLIDGSQSVGFLVKVKEFMENPGKILLDV